jgi:acetyl esterase
LPPADIEHETVEQEGLTVDLTIVRPIGVKEEGPAFLFFHSGGFMLGDLPTHERFVRDLASDSGYLDLRQLLTFTRSKVSHSD